MSFPTRPIARLPTRTASHLRSLVVLPSLPSILTELIQNSLDANATRVELTIDLARWTLACHDNGHGITWSDLQQLGHARYSTSKLGGRADHHPHQPDQGVVELGDVGTFGFRGEALASMVDVGILEVLTRPGGGEGEDSYELVASGRTNLHLALASKDRVGIGTSVWVREIFSNYPVRRRPLASAAARASLTATLRQAVTTLALAHPHVSFSLIDTAADDAHRLLSVARSGEGVLGRWRQMWGRAGVERVAHLDEADPGGEVTLTGFCSLTASHSKASQYIYVNSRPLGVSPLHKLINSLFASSTFARYASSHLVAPTSPTPSQQRGPSQPQPTADAPGVTTPKRFRTTPKKVTERHPIFVLLLRLPPHLVDVTLEPEKRAVEFVEEERVMTFVERAVRGWLVAQGFLADRRARERSPGASVRAPLSDEELTPVKRVREGIARYLSPHGPLSPRPKTPVRGREFGAGAVTSNAVSTRVHSRVRAATPIRAPVLDSPVAVQEEGGGIVVDPEAAEPVRWEDPVTGQVVLIDPRTGNSWPIGRKPAAPADIDRPRENRKRASFFDRSPALVDRSRLRTRPPEEGEEVPPTPEWMANALEDWANPVFPAAPAAVPALPAIELDDCHHSDKEGSPPPGLSPWLHHAGVTRARARQMDAFFRNSTRVEAHHLLGDVSSQRVTKPGLAGARFIAQVDRKFLLVAVPCGEAEDDDMGYGALLVGRGKWARAETLAMVDQHAADERVRVERIWEAVAGRVARGEEVEREVFEPPLGVVVSREEYDGLGHGSKVAQFGRWGVDLVLERDDGGAASGGEGGARQDYAQVWLKAVPKVVAPRLRVEPRLRQELVRSYLGEAFAGGIGGGARGKAGEATAAAVLRECPPVLVELMNSLACRGAVMFNDELSRRQCETLVRKLAQTRFPFQCAHGRPTLQPVVNLPRTAAVGRGVRALDWGSLLEAGRSAELGPAS